MGTDGPDGDPADTRTAGETGGDTSHDDPPPDAGSDGPFDYPLRFAIDPSVVHVRLTRAVLGGDAGCHSENRSVDYDRVTHEMKWPGCAAGDTPSPGGGGSDYPSSSRVLTAAEVTRVEAALTSVTYTDPPKCGGYDGLEYFMTTTDAAGGGEQKYSAYDINCYGYRNAPKIVDVYALFVELRP